MIRRNFQPRIKEDYVIVLDFLPHGYPFKGNRIPICQAIGKKHLLLLEIVPKRNVNLTPLSEIYIGSDKRELVHHVGGKITFNDLTSTAKLNFNDVLSKLIDENEQKWVAFFNKATPITTRLHKLELLPGIGKKHMWAIIDERDEKPFESFEDISNRIKLIPNPKELIIKRIKIELNNEDKYKVFCL